MADHETVETKVTEFDDGSAIVETVTTETEFEPGNDPPIIEAETVAEIIAEETPISDAVAIAAIEGDTAVQIAEINAEVQIASIEAAQEERTWQEELAELRTNMQEQITEAVTVALSVALANQSTPQLSEIVETMETESLTPPSMPEEISETQTEVILESEEEKPEPEAVRVRIRRRLI